MAKGGVEKSYFVGDITHNNKEWRNIGNKVHGGLEISVTPENKDDENIHDKEMSPSQESRKVRFMGIIEENENDHGGGESKMSNHVSPMKHVNASSKSNSKNSSPMKLSAGSVNASPLKQSYADSKQSYNLAPSGIKGNNSKASSISSNHVSTAGRNDSRNTSLSVDSSDKFHANSNNTPDSELLVFPEKATSKNSQKKSNNKGLGSQRSENFRFHAQGYERGNSNKQAGNKKQPKNQNQRASDGTGKGKYTDSTPALPPARQNGSLVTSQGLLASQQDLSTRSRKNSKVSISRQSVVLSSRKDSDRIPSIPKRPRSSKTSYGKRVVWGGLAESKSRKSAKSSKSYKSEQPDIIESPKQDSNHEEDEKGQPESTPTNENKDTEETPLQQADPEKPTSTASRPESEKSKVSFSQKSQKSEKSHATSQKSQVPTESVKTERKDSTKPSIEKDSMKFVATYNRSQASEKSSAKMSEKSAKRSEKSSAKMSEKSAKMSEKSAKMSEKSDEKADSKNENEAPSPMSHATDEPGTNNADFKWHAPPGQYETNAPVIKTKSKNVKINNYGSEVESGRTTSTSNTVYNKKLSFKLKAMKSKNKKPMYSRDKKASEVTPRKEVIERSKSENARPISLRLDRDASIYRSHTHLWETETEELTHHPSTNDKTDVMLAYTGERNTRDALKSSRGKRPKEIKEAFTVFTTRSKIPPWHEGEYMLNKREAKAYIQMKSVYDKPHSNNARKKQFFKKLQNFQVDMAKQEILEMQQRERKKIEDKARQAIELQQLRQRFEDEAWHRFHTQYVTSRILEHEKLNRFQYGLPEEPDGDPEFPVKMKRKKKVPLAVLSIEKLKKLNQKKYSQMFEASKGPAWDPNEKEPKMEGIDTVMLEVEDSKGPRVLINPVVKEEGNLKEKKRLVKDVIKEAKQELLQVPGTGNNTGLTPRSPTVTEPSTNTVSKADNSSLPRKTPSFFLDDNDDDDDDDDMSDIFERAKRKYNLDVDDEDEDNISRIR